MTTLDGVYMSNDTCRIENCNKKRDIVTGSKLCGMHRYRLRKFKSTELPPKYPQNTVTKCNKHGYLTKDQVYRNGFSKKNTPLYKCKICSKIKHQIFLNKDPEKTKILRRGHESRRKKYDGSKESITAFRIRLRSKFNLTIEQYEQMVKNQNNCCLICGLPETRKTYERKKVTKLCIDHCHKSGKVRGLLCWSCNGMLGMARDSITTLEEAIKYLKENG
jgi:Recombination endonuclease VII